VSRYLDDGDVTLYHGDSAAVLATLPEGSVDCVVTSPPYFGLRDYGYDEQIGLEDTPAAFVARLVDVFREVRRVLAPHGTCWVNMGDSYASGGRTWRAPNTNGMRSGASAARMDWRPADPEGIKPKDLLGIPWRLAFALQDDGWWLRSDVIWAKPNPMPESVTDRPTKAHEYLFLLTKAPRYYWDAEGVREEGAGRLDVGPATRGRNIRTVWTFPTEPNPEAHFATFPRELVRRCLTAGCKPGGTVLDPFIGSGTTAVVARAMGMRCVGIDGSAEYLAMARKRTQQLSLLGGAA